MHVRGARLLEPHPAFANGIRAHPDAVLLRCRRGQHDLEAMRYNILSVNNN